MNKPIFILLTVFLLSGCEMRTETIPKERWVGMLGSVFSNATLRLNNFTPNYGEYSDDPATAFHKPDDSFLTVMLSGRSVRWPLDIPTYRSGPSTIYVNDMNSESVTFDARNRLYYVDIVFEDHGPEAKTNCVNDAGCFAIGDRDVNLASPFVSIAFRPSVEDGRLSYSNVYVNLMTSSTTISGCSDDLFAFLCDLFISDKDGFVKDRFERGLTRNLTTPATKAALTTVINAYLERIGVDDYLVQATINRDGDLILTYRD